MPPRTATRLAALVLVLLVIPTPSASAESAESPDSGLLRVQTFGEQGRAVVFLPALNTHADLWAPWAASLAASHRVLVVMPAGFPGEPTARFDDGFYAALVPALANLLAARELADATLVGSSIGGLMALMLANEQPARVRNVLAVDSLPYLAGLFLPGIAPADASAQARTLAQRTRNLPHDVYLQQQLAGLARYTLKSEFRATLAAWLEMADRETSILAFEETLALDYRPRLPSIAQPVLVLAAWQSELPLPKAHVEQLYRDQYAELPDVDVRVVENSRHFVMVDRPDAFETALAEVTEL